MKLPTLGPKGLAVMGIILCFLIACFFSGCSLDDIAGDATGARPCVFYPPEPGTYNIIYHVPGDPKDTFKHAQFQTDLDGRPFVLDALHRGVSGGVDCDGINSYFKVN
jgi:hypothetical protein